MLHVVPTAVETAKPVFCPYSYIAYMRAHGVSIEARERDGHRQLVWDVSNAHEVPFLDDAPCYDPDDRRQAEGQIYDVLRAEEWIAGARNCGLIVVPWASRPGEGGVLQFAQEDEGPNDLSSALERFCRHPARDAVRECRKGVVFETLCFEMGIDPLDPAVCAKVNARYAKEYMS